MGYAVVTSVLAPAASFALTDLATVKVELSLGDDDTSNDAWITTNAIPQVSRAIARYCKRVFAPEVVQDVFDVQQDPYPWQTPGGFPQLELQRWPVLGVASVVQTLMPATATAPAQTRTLAPNMDYRLDPATGRLLRLNCWTGVGTLWEAIPVTVIYTAGLGALVTEADSVPASPGPYTVTVAQAPSFSCDGGVSYANGTALAAVAASPAQGQYAVDIATGTYTFAAADDGQELAFAYATVDIPDDLIELALRLITSRFRGKGRDPNLIAQETPGVGSQRWWFDNTAGQKGPFPPDIQNALDEGYRVPTIA